MENVDKMENVDDLKLEALEERTEFFSLCDYAVYRFFHPGCRVD